MADTSTENYNAQGTEQVPEERTPRWLERLRKRHPDRKFADEAEAEDEFYADYDRTIGEYDALKDDNARILETLQENPEFAEVFAAIRDGMPLRVALARVVDFDAVRPQQGEPDYEEFIKSAEVFKQRQAEVAANRKKIEENQAQSRVEIEDFFKGVGADDTERDGFADFLQGLFDDVFDGKMGKAALKKLWQAYKYEEDVEASRLAGEVAGRNAGIEAKREKNKSTDGLPDAGGGVAPPETQRRKIFNTDSWGK